MTDIKWCYKSFTESDLESVLALRLKIFQDPSYDKTRWTWQYLDNPQGKSVIDLAVDIQDENILAGHYAVISYEAKLGGHSVRCAQSLDTFTSGDYRRQGIFVDLAEKTYENAKGQGIDYIFGFPNKSSYPGFVKKLKFEDPFGFKIFKVPLSLNYFSKKIFGKSLFRGIPVKFKYSTEGFSTNEISSLPENFDKIWETFKGLIPNMIKRDSAYYNWRFLNCPDRKYKVYEFKSAEKTNGFFVLGIDEENSFTHFVDFIIDDLSLVPNLIKSVVNESIKLKSTCLTIFINEENPVIKDLEGLSFSSVNKSDDFRFIIRSLNTEETSPDLLEAKNWFLTAGDTDFY